MKKFSIYLMCFLMMNVAAFCAERQAAPVDFSDFDGGLVGARALGMGNSLVAAPYVDEAAYWNPAGLNFISKNMFTICFDLMRSSRLKTSEIVDAENLRGRKLMFFGFAGQNGGVSFRPLVNKYTETILNANDPENNKRTKEIRINSFTLSLAQKTEGKNSVTSVGMNLSYLSGALALTDVQTGETPYANVSDGNGFSIDWGTIIQLSEVLNIGLMVHNIPGYIYWNDYKKTQLPILLRGGFAYSLSRISIFTMEYEKRYYRDTGYKPHFLHFGLEQYLLQWLCVRGGVYGEDVNDSEKVNYTAGVGLLQGNYSINLAFRKYKMPDALRNNELTDVYQYLISIGMPFGEQKKEKS